MSTQANTKDSMTLYQRFQWVVQDDVLEPELVRDSLEIEQIARAIAEVTDEPIQLYTTS